MRICIRLILPFTPGACRLAYAVAAVCVLTAIHAGAGAPEGLNHTVVQVYYDFPATDNAGLVSFDWDDAGRLHYSVGDPHYGLKLEVNRVAAEGVERIYEKNDVWVGSRVTVIGRKVYFNDGGDLTRSMYNYFMYDAAHPAEVEALLAAPYGAGLWGLAKRSDNEFFASGDDGMWGPASIYYSLLDDDGYLESVPPLNIGIIGESPGPLAFDAAGNLYYVPGYVFAGEPNIYRWNAAEVNAALANPVAAALSPDGAAWATLPGHSGATGMTTDAEGNVFLTATTFGMPSELLAYAADDAKMVQAAVYEGRLETVRFRDDAVYVSCADGVFRIPLLQTLRNLPEEQTSIWAAPGETVILTLDNCGIGTREYYWYRLDAHMNPAPVGENMAHYSFTAEEADDGAVFYCVVSDALGTVESSHFTVNLETQMPVLNTWRLLLSGAVLALLGRRTILTHRRTH